MMNRREILYAGAASAAALTSSCRGQTLGHTLCDPGVALYTVRHELSERPEETIRALADFGYRHVEMGIGDVDRLRPYLNDAGLAVTSTGIDSEAIRADELVPSIAAAERQEVRFLVLATPVRETLDEYRKYALALNAAGAMCGRSGIDLCLHFHSFEFESFGNQRPFDVIMDVLDFSTVSLEVDAFWISMGGLDPAGFLREHRARCRLLHLKDRRAGIQDSYLPARQFIENTPQAFEEVGDGILDFPEILRAAQEVGVTYAYVEQDSTPGDAVESVRQSFTYLQSLNA